uniref:Small nuclear ribonucleoprotein U11/U12 subunit 48 n=1 Tax=Leptobrachium leishanense TaxID=445787 RepID=A0A8C5M3X0_9ANUR
MEDPGSCARQEELQELQEFTEQCQRRLGELLQELGWKEEHGLEGEDLGICPYDGNHRMPRAALDKHVTKCRLKRLGYSKEETEVLDTCFYYEKAKIPSVAIDKVKQFQILKEARDRVSNGGDSGPYEKSAYSTTTAVEVPLNHKRVVCDLTQADRLAIFDYVLQETRNQRSMASLDELALFEDLAAKINQGDDQKGPKSHLELMAEMRDYKRRRQSYRAKNVHLTKKSYTEIIRDVIAVHMEELASHWSGDAHDEASSTISSSSVGRRRDVHRSPSVDSRHSAGSHKEKHSGRYRERRRRRSRDKEDPKVKRERFPRKL